MPGATTTLYSPAPTLPAETPDAPHLRSPARTPAAPATSADTPRLSSRPGGAAREARRMVKRGAIRITGW